MKKEFCFNKNVKLVTKNNRYMIAVTEDNNVSVVGADDKGLRLKYHFYDLCKGNIRSDT